MIAVQKQIAKMRAAIMLQTLRPQMFTGIGWLSGRKLATALERVLKRSRTLDAVSYLEEVKWA